MSDTPPLPPSPLSEPPLPRPDRLRWLRTLAGVLVGLAAFPALWAATRNVLPDCCGIQERELSGAATAALTILATAAVLHDRRWRLGAPVALASVLVWTCAIGMVLDFAATFGQGEGARGLGTGALVGTSVGLVLIAAWGRSGQWHRRPADEPFTTHSTMSGTRVPLGPIISAVLVLIPLLVANRLLPPQARDAQACLRRELCPSVEELLRREVLVKLGPVTWASLNWSKHDCTLWSNGMTWDYGGITVGNVNPRWVRQWRRGSLQGLRIGLMSAGVRASRRLTPAEQTPERVKKVFLESGLRPEFVARLTGPGPELSATLHGLTYRFNTRSMTAGPSQGNSPPSVYFTCSGTYRER